MLKLLLTVVLGVLCALFASSLMRMQPPVASGDVSAAEHHDPTPIVRVVEAAATPLPATVVRPTVMVPAHNSPERPAVTTTVTAPAVTTQVAPPTATSRATTGAVHTGTVPRPTSVPPSMPVPSTPSPTLQPTTPTVSPTTAPAPPTWTLTAVGDIMLGRSVLQQMLYYDDIRRPFRQTYPLLRAADLTVGNLESPLSDRIPPPSDPNTMVFIGPARAAAGLRWAGIDAVSVANNHTLTHGQHGLMDTISAVEEHGIAAFGGGRDWNSAYAPAVFTVKGQRVALLGFDDVYGWRWRDRDAPGIATAWEDDVRSAVAAAKRDADVVIPFFHWGAEYTDTPSEQQVRLAHAAIDSGADLVLGSHPHWVQSTETYRGKLIVYSLGNFIFDQMWSRETRQGAIGHFTFRGRQMVEDRYTPVLILDYNQPVPATGSDYRAVMRRLRASR